MTGDAASQIRRYNLLISVCYLPTASCLRLSVLAFLEGDK
ncbi:MAG: hypothetical protein QOJ70_540 [Acidobacteriota bacterium]|nr:hypothetical protein [Acidobacteriota bacterium]